MYDINLFTFHIIKQHYSFEAYRRLFNFGAETLQRDFDLEHAF